MSAKAHAAAVRLRDMARRTDMHIEDRCAASFAAELLDRLPYLVERTEAVVSTDVGTENWDALDEVLTYFAKELAGESTEPTEAP